MTDKPVISEDIFRNKAEPNHDYIKYTAKIRENMCTVLP